MRALSEILHKRLTRSGYDCRVTPWALISPARLAGSGLLRTQSDARLVDLVRAGNDRAFEAIVIRYHRPLLRHCRRLLPAGRAEDAVQQAFLYALEAIRADGRELQLAPWLHRIAHNAAIDALRRLDSDWDELDDRIDGVEPTHAAAERRARFRSVVATMGSLPERQRRALVLRELEGRSYEEIAVTLGVSGHGVRQLLNRARNAMRAGASALVPPVLLGRLAGSQAGPRVAELVDPPGTSALLAKATATVAAGAVAVVAVTTPGDRLRSPHAHARPHPPALESRADAGGRSAEPAAAAQPGVERQRSDSRDSRERQAGGHTASPGGGPGGAALDEDDARDVAPRRHAGSQRESATGDPPDVDDGDAPAGGDDGRDDDAAAGADQGPDDDAPVAGTPPPQDDDGAGDDDDVVAPSGAPLPESPAGASEDDSDDGGDGLD
jgi:RNA polymerase sigma factor (sigma-70 family)